MTSNGKAYDDGGGKADGNGMLSYLDDGGTGAIGRRRTTPENLDPEPTSAWGLVKAWPKQTFCIIGNEFCERFSYYGMRTVLTLYLINILKFNNDKATVFFHSFTVLAYTSPLLGSILADGYIGKFWTIFSISLVYATGEIVLAFASTFKHESSIHPTLDLVGLCIIALGTGGIKPCVAAFGGDQFKPHYLRMISVYFSIFYFSINAGSTISTFLTPIFRSQPCLDQDSCYPLAFGVPAVLMIVATITFMLGSFFYKKYPPKENVIFRVVGTMRVAIVNCLRSHNKRPHVIDYYLDTHNCFTDPKCIALAVKDKPIGHVCAQKMFCKDVQSLLRVIVMMLPVPMFWALYDQQGSRWIIQAVAMDSRITKPDGFSLLPDQMATLNAILIMVFIPIFQFGIYPLCKAIGIRTTPLRRMTVGGLLAAVAFVICGFVQLGVNQTLPDVPDSKHVHIGFVNAHSANSGCIFTVTDGKGYNQTLPPGESTIDDKTKEPKMLNLYRMLQSDLDKVQFTFSASDRNCTGIWNTTSVGFPLTYQFTANQFLPREHPADKAPSGNGYYIVASPLGIFANSTIYDKPQEGQGQFAVSINMVILCRNLSKEVKEYNFTNSRCKMGIGTYLGPLALCRYPKTGTPPSGRECKPREQNDFYAWQYNEEDLKNFDDTDMKYPVNTTKNYNVTIYAFQDVRPGNYRLYYMNDNPIVKNVRTPETVQVYPVDNVTLEIDAQGGVYTLTVTTEDDDSPWNVMQLHTVVPENHVSILWQIPQYVVITAGEILFSITGLEFAYSQAAPSMKSVVQAIWCFTVAIGDLIIIVIAALALFDNLAIEMFAYAGAMLVVMGIFALLAIFYYTYADYTETGQDDGLDSFTATGSNSTCDEEGII